MRGSFVLGAWVAVGCAQPAPCPASPPCAASAGPPAVASASASGAPATPTSGLALLVRPIATPVPLVHVEIAIDAPGLGTTWHVTRGTPDRVVHASARDASGDLAVDVAAAAAGVDVHLSRAPSGLVTLAYDVLAGDDAPDDPLGLLVLDDRFRGAGEKLVALPAGVEDARVPTYVRIDGEPLRASGAASSLGVGVTRRATIQPRALRRATFLAGSMGVQVIDDPGGGHDEGAWLGYTSFDPRPTIAELAQVRSAMRDFFKSQLDAPWTYLLVSQTRPIGSFTTTPRSNSLLLQVGPGEAWSAWLRLSAAQQLARIWIGGVLQVAPQPGQEAQTLLFTEGLSRYVATVLLARVGLLSPDDVRDAVAGEISVVATSPHRALDAQHLAELALHDETARATLMARVALYAMRESTAIRARSKGARGLDTVLAGLVERAEQEKGKPLPVDVWQSAITAEDPDASKTFDAYMNKGGSVSLPPDALGPCFRAGTGEYVAYDPGFDLEATRVSREGRIVGVRAGGPADKAGLRDDDVVERMTARDGDASVPVMISVVRGAKKFAVTYPPRGAHGQGQTWTRNKQLPDDKCGLPP
jgi:hypothetical protein